MTETLAWLTACVVVGVGGYWLGCRRTEAWWSDFCETTRLSREKMDAKRGEVMHAVLAVYPTSRGGRAIVRALGGTVPPLPKRPRPSSAPTEEPNP